MRGTGFHTEWMTFGDHRILLECRDSFPDEDLRLLAQVAARTCERHSSYARLVKIFYDNKAEYGTFFVASVAEEDRELEHTIADVIHTMENSPCFGVNVVIVKRGNVQSDHYNHARHLFSEALPEDYRE